MGCVSSLQVGSLIEGISRPRRAWRGLGRINCVYVCVVASTYVFRVLPPPFSFSAASQHGTQKRGERRDPAIQHWAQ